MLYISHHPKKAVNAATNRTEPRQHEAVDDAVRYHAGRCVRSWCGCRVEEFALDYVYLLPLGNAAAIAAASCPPRLCGLQIGSPVGRMHPCLRDKVIRYSLAVEIVPPPRPSHLLLEAACALATAETILISSVYIAAANLAQNGGRRRVSRQRQPLRRQPRGKSVVVTISSHAITPDRPRGQ